MTKYLISKDGDNTPATTPAANVGLVSFEADQSPDATQIDRVLRTLGTTKTLDPEWFNTGSDQGNLQAALNYGGSVNDTVYIKLRPKTYTLGTVGSSATALTWDGNHGTVILDARGATINYVGTGIMWYSTLHVGGNNPPRISVTGGSWSSATGTHGFYGLDIRGFYYGDMKVEWDTGIAFYQINQDSFAERNTYERIDDHSSKQLLVMDVTPFKSAPTGGTVTFTTGTNLVAFTIPHSTKVGEAVKFNGLSGSFGITDNQTYYAATAPTNTTLTLSTTADGLSPVTITANGTAAQGWIAPAGSMARTRLVEAKLQGGVATFCKIQVTNGAAPYDSQFSVRGNIPDGVGILDIFNAHTMGNTTVDLKRCEAVTNIAGGAFLVRWGQSGGFPPTMQAEASVIRGMYLFDPLAAVPDNTQVIFGPHQFYGIKSSGLQGKSSVDIYGRTNRTDLTSHGGLNDGPINPSLWVTDGTGVSGHPADQFGHLMITPAPSRGIYVDISGGVGPEVWQRLDQQLLSTLASSTFVRVNAYTAVPNEIVRADATSGTVPITLPAAPLDGTRIVVKALVASVARPVTVTCGGSDTFNKTGGSTSVTLSTNNASVMLQYVANGTYWVIVSTDAGTAVTSVVPGQLIGETEYIPTTIQTDVTTTAGSAAFADLSAAPVTAAWTSASASMFDVTFVAPANGKVRVEVEAYVTLSGTGSSLAFQLVDITNSSTPINNSELNLLKSASTTQTKVRYNYKVTGLTAGQTYTYRPQWHASTTVTATLSAGGKNGPVLVSVRAGF